MTLDRKDYKSAIPQLEKRLSEVEKIGKDAFNKFEDIAHQTQLAAAEAEKKVLALDYQMTTTRVQMEYQLCTTGQTPVEANWQTTMPSITYNSYQGKTLWYRSKTYVNDIVVQTTEPMTVNLMDGVYAFVNTVSGNTGWTTIDGDTIQTGKITSHNGYCYFDIDNNSFQMKDASTAALSNSVLAWQNGLLYVKGKIAVGSSSTDQKYYTEMTGGGFDIVADDVNLAHLGFDTGQNQSGSTSTSKYPYYTFGKRLSDTPLTRGNYSVAEGNNTIASGWGSHAEGNYTTASGKYGAHAEGHYTEAIGDYSRAQNFHTVAGYNTQTVIGSYNDNDPLDLFEIGNGTSNTARSNALAVDWDGKLFTKQIQAGTIAQTTVSANSYVDVPVTFPKSMSETPVVTVSLISNSTAGGFGNVSAAVLRNSVSSTGFTCRIHNADTSSRMPAVSWIAMNVGTT